MRGGKISEAAILKQMMLEASKCDLVVFRNHTGMVKGGDGFMHRFGLCKGSSDLIGWCKLTGRFAAIEVKRVGGKPTIEQVNFIEQVRKAGGFGVVIDDANNLKKELDTWRKGL